MEYGYDLPEVVTAEENERRLFIKGELGKRTYQIVSAMKGQDDMPIAREFAMYDLYLTTESKNSIVGNIPGQEILPIEFSE